MKYIINGYGNVKIQEHKREKIQIITGENIHYDFKIPNIYELSILDPDSLMIKSDNTIATKISDLSGQAGKLQDLIFVECVGNGNTMISKT